MSAFGAGVEYHMFVIYKYHKYRVSLVLPCCLLELSLENQGNIFLGKLTDYFWC